MTGFSNYYCTFAPTKTEKLIMNKVKTSLCLEYGHKALCLWALVQHSLYRGKGVVHQDRSRFRQVVSSPLSIYLGAVDINFLWLFG